jgi:hypothetical protein
MRWNRSWLYYLFLVAWQLDMVTCQEKRVVFPLASFVFAKLLTIYQDSTYISKSASGMVIFANKSLTFDRRMIRIFVVSYIVTHYNLTLSYPTVYLNLMHGGRCAHQLMLIGTEQWCRWFVDSESDIESSFMCMHVKHYQTLSALLSCFVSCVVQVIESRCQSRHQSTNNILK